MDTRMVITNDCTCCDENNEPTLDCYGCWDSEVDNFYYEFRTFFDSNEDKWWHVEGLPLWNRTLSGKFRADTAEKFLQSITVDASWRLSCFVQDNVMHATLSHHDVPMGKTMTIKPTTSPEMENL